MATKKYSNKTNKKPSKKEETTRKEETIQKEEPEKKNALKLKKSSLITIIIITLLIILLVKQVSYQEEEEDEFRFYKEYEFERHPQLENVWLTTVKIGEGEQKREFRYHPLDLEKYEYDKETDQYFYLAQIVNGKASLTFYDEVLKKGSGLISLSGHDLAKVLKLFFFEEVEIFAEGLEDHDWITCESASINNLVIEFKHGEPRVTSKDFCVEIYFEEPEQALKLTYRLIYDLFGVMG